jgi:hypothetical protein
MTTENAKIEEAREQGFVDDELVGGESGSVEDDDDMDAEQRIYQELLEEEAAKRRAAALEALNKINTGQAFSTIRALKRNETLQASKARLPATEFAKLTGDIVSSAKLPPLAFPTASAVPMDLSSLLPGPAFLPSPAYAVSPETLTGKQSVSPVSMLDAANAQSMQGNNVDAEPLDDIGDSPVEAVPPGTDQAVDNPLALPANDDSCHGGSSDLKSKLMATWHYSEVLLG